MMCTNEKSKNTGYLLVSESKDKKNKKVYFITDECFTFQPGSEKKFLNEESDARGK